MNEYVSYEDLKAYLRVTETDADDLLRGFTLQASRVFDAATRRRFYPRLETRHYDHPYDVSVLVLDDDLLEVGTFTTMNGYIVLAAGDYYLTCGGQHNLTPCDRIEMRTDGNHPALKYQATPQRANTVAGIWGYHEDWSGAWDAVDALADAVQAGDTTIQVGDTQVFQGQQLIRIGTEYLYVTDRTTVKDSPPQPALAVRRGVNGTTAAAHDEDAAVSIYRPMQDVWHAVRRLAAWLYGQKDQPYTERIQAAQQGIISIPEGMPADVKLTIRRYSR